MNQVKSMISTLHPLFLATVFSRFMTNGVSTSITVQDELVRPRLFGSDVAVVRSTSSTGLLASGLEITNSIISSSSFSSFFASIFACSVLVSTGVAWDSGAASTGFDSGIMPSISRKSFVL
ncbi:hypothetical protein BJ741DRAFT_593364 [Chytriomyces cf. hyalinus JEL632]|nr:hypothetical protein BJ741DRAFT_593364 [Chytriomyces cf. hyalinus JEL632]